MVIAGPPVLGPDEPVPFGTSGFPEPARPVLIVCDHASPGVPVAMGSLGLPPDVLQSHIGWDVGAWAVARGLSRALAVPAIGCNYSRLVVDCNRHLDDPAAFPEWSAGIPVPANQNLGGDEKIRRAEAIYWPYHNQIAATLWRLRRDGQVPVLVAVHSFTPVLDGIRRPWHLGILWRRDGRIALPLLQALRADPRIVVGDNEPYSGWHPAGFTIDYHAAAQGFAHVAIEVRQDLLAQDRDAGTWAGLLAAALGPILADEYLYSTRV